MYELLLFGHLLGVGLLVLGTGMFLAGTEALRRARTVSEAQGAAALSRLATRVLVGGGPLLLGFGFTLAARRWSLAEPWIVTSLALVALLGVNGLRSERWLARIHNALRDADAVPPAAHASWHHGANRATLAGLAELEFLMTVKPANTALLLSLLMAAALATGLAITGRFPRLSPAARSGPLKEEGTAGSHPGSDHAGDRGERRACRQDRAATRSACASSRACSPMPARSPRDSAADPDEMVYEVEEFRPSEPPGT